MALCKSVRLFPSRDFEEKLKVKRNLDSKKSRRKSIRKYDISSHLKNNEMAKDNYQNRKTE